MKTITLYTSHADRIDGDSFSRYFFDAESALKSMANEYAHLTADERESNDLYVDGYTVRIPDEYQPTTADQLVNDLFNNDVDSPDVEPGFGGFTSEQIFYKTIEEYLKEME